MTIEAYFEAVSRMLQAESDAAKAIFRTHKPTAGSSREKTIAQFLRKHLPNAFGVGAGLILSRDDVFSNQADIVVYDQLLNRPLNSDRDENLFPVESVYALIEVKSHLSPRDITDSLTKCRRFKMLHREFHDAPHCKPRLMDSLFVIIAFEAADPATVKEAFQQSTKELPPTEIPDLLVVPGSLVIASGGYHELANLGQPGSAFRMALESGGPEAISTAQGEGMTAMDVKENALTVFMTWFTSWLQQAGPRTVLLSHYLPETKQWGHFVR